MHECFASLTSTMEHTGTLQNESRELERRIEQEEARANVLNMEQVIYTVPYLTLPYLTVRYRALPDRTLPYLTLPCRSSRIWRRSRRRIIR